MLVEALAWLTYAMDQADEDPIDTDTAVSWMEDVAVLIGQLGSEDRSELLVMVQRLASETADERMRSAYLAFIEGYGLDDEDED
jgi:hypothetical protein